MYGKRFQLRILDRKKTSNFTPMLILEMMLCLKTSSRTLRKYVITSPMFRRQNPVDTSTLADLGGVPGARPPMGPNSFVFTYILTQKCPCQRSTPPLKGARPPYGKSWIRHCTSIIDLSCPRFRKRHQIKWKLVLGRNIFTNFNQNKFAVLLPGYH